MKNVVADYYVPNDDSDEERINSTDLAIAEGADVVIMPGYRFGACLAEEQDLYPDVIFLGLDITENDVVTIDGYQIPLTENTCIFDYREEQAGYLAGYAAVKEGYHHFGYIGGIAVPAVMRYGYGYVQGINDAAEELSEHVSIKYYYCGQFYGDAAITARMEGWYADGVEVVFACGGGIWTSVKDAAKAYDGKIIGVDFDQANSIGESCLTSATKGIAETIESVLDSCIDGSFGEKYSGQSNTLGLQSGDYVGLPTEPESFRFQNFTIEEYNIIVEEIKSGIRIVSSDISSFPQVNSYVDAAIIK